MFFFKKIQKPLDKVAKKKYNLGFIFKKGRAMSRIHNAFNANAFDFSLNVFSEKAFENAFGANANAFNALSMMNMHTLVC